MADCRFRRAKDRSLSRSAFASPSLPAPKREASDKQDRSSASPCPAIFPVRKCDVPGKRGCQNVSLHPPLPCDEIRAAKRRVPWPARSAGHCRLEGGGAEPWRASASTRHGEAPERSAGRASESPGGGPWPGGGRERSATAGLETDPMREAGRAPQGAGRGSTLASARRSGGRTLRPWICRGRRP